LNSLKFGIRILSEKVCEILSHVTEKTILESLAVTKKQTLTHS